MVNLSSQNWIFDADSPHWDALLRISLITLIVIGIMTFGDYGLTWDEEVQRGYGDRVLDWYGSFFKDRSSLTYGNLYLYGGFFEAFLQLAVKTLGTPPYETRHLLNFGCLPLAAHFTAKLARLLFDRRTAFLAAIILILTPQFYAHSFFNSKDIPFAAFGIMSTYFLVKSFISDSVDKKALLLSGLTIGLVLAIRIGGFLYFGYAAFTAFLFLIYKLKTTDSRDRLNLFAHTFTHFMAVVGIAWLVMLIFWPWAQISPIKHPWLALTEAAKFKWIGLVQFNGALHWSTELPKSYIPIWAIKTTPDLVVVGFFLGLITLLATFIKNLRKKSAIISSILIISIIGPITMVLLLKSVLYDGIRHFLFLFPAISIVASVGINKALALKGINRCAWVVLAGCLLLNIIDLYQLHPYQHIYFNRIFSKGQARDGFRFETDYWGSSYKEGLEWLLSYAHSKHVSDGKKFRVSNCSNNFLTGYFIDTRSELASVFEPTSWGSDADFMLATARHNCPQSVKGNLIHIISKRGVPLVYVFERK